MDDPVTRWCRDVVSGKIVSGHLAIAAADRHLADLKDGEKRGLFWKPELAEKPMQFFPSVLTITAGPENLIGTPFNLLPYHTFIIGSLFGWRRANGTRRFRSIWLETGRGQAKGPLMAGLTLFETFFSGIQRCEAYAVGETVVTSSALFRDAVALARGTIPGCEQGDTLESRRVLTIRGSGDISWQIERHDTQSKFQALAIGDSISGPKPHMVLIDEIHELKSTKAIEQWSSALGKAAGSPLMIMATNTPGINQIVGTDYSDHYQRVVKREIIDDSSLAYIARTDPTDDPMNDPSCWIKSLPALGITYPAENVEIEVSKARQMPAKRLSVLRLYFGVPVGSDGFWIDHDAWVACQDTVDEAEMKNYPCYLALDLSQRNDMTAMARVWKDPTGHLYVKITYWKPTDTLAEAEIEDKAPYSAWVEAKHLIATPGKTIGKDFVVAEVQSACLNHDVKLMAFDPAFMVDFLQAAADMNFACYEWRPDKPEGSGLKMIRHAQGSRGMQSDRMLWMPRSFQAMCDAILEHRITFDLNPVTTYCASNVKLETDAMGNSWAGKPRTRSHNDGIVAACMGIGAALHEPPTKPAFRSIWESDFITEPPPPQPTPRSFWDEAL
jgi:phage terminase large subunit-like protein